MTQKNKINLGDISLQKIIDIQNEIIKIIDMQIDIITKHEIIKLQKTKL